MTSNYDNVLSFKGQDFYIGIDVHKKQWTIRVISMNMGLDKAVSIDPSAGALFQYLNTRWPGGNYSAVYEAGFCGFGAARELNQLGIKCMVTHAADVPTSQKERLNRNDKVDANKLGRSLSNKELKPIYIPAKQAEEYRYLNRSRQRMIKDQTRIKNRIKSALHYFGIRIPSDFEDRRWSGSFITWLFTIEFETEYGKFAFNSLLDELIETRIRISRTLKKMREMAQIEVPFNIIIPFLLSVPGIGFITAMTLAAEIMDMGRFRTLEKLASYAGLVPSVQSSDETQTNLGISQRRNKYLRSMLIEAAWKAVKTDPALTMKFSRLCRRMNQNKAIVRIAKILLSRIRHVWNKQEPYVKAVVA